MLYGLGFERRVALRFLREGRMQTLLIIVGVAAGVAVIAYISALISGLQSNTLNKTLGAQAHITLRAPDDLVTPARASEPGSTLLTETQPRAASALGSELAGAAAGAGGHGRHRRRVAHDDGWWPGAAR